MESFNTRADSTRCYVNTICYNSVFLSPQLDDEDSILPHKLQAALEHVLDKRRELACEKGDLPNGDSAFLLQNFIHFMCVFLLEIPPQRRCKMIKSK